MIYNWYKISKKEYGWINIEIPSDISKKISSFSKKIPERELYTEIGSNGHSHGLEDYHHITVLYGVHTSSHKKIKKIMEGYKKGKIKLGLTNVFKSEKYDVLKITVHSNFLRNIHYYLKENLTNSDEFDIYRPHVTIGYLKCGNGEKYKFNKTFENLEFECDTLIFEDFNKNKSKISLR